MHVICTSNHPPRPCQAFAKLQQSHATLLVRDIILKRFNYLNLAIIGVFGVVTACSNI